MRSAEPITERRAPALADLDLLDTLDLVERINDEDASVAPAVRAAAPALAAAVDVVAARLAAGGRLVYVGAGSSGRLALVDAVECGPTFGLEPGRVVAVVAGGAGAQAEAQEAAEDDARAGAEDVAALSASRADVVVALSASGCTPYTLAAAGTARAAGAFVVAVTCAEATPLEAAADLAVVVPVGPEVIAGSTRMKAGTAQKLVLNTLSTGAMVRLGRTYGNLMVDVVASNEKLRLRAQRAVAAAAGVDDAEAASALRAAGGEPKTAIVALRLGLDPTEARARLAAADGVVRRALEG
jgi:N-acetylmuramic acid 6-phosphate etherase